MTTSLAATAAILFTIGTYLVLQRKLSRIIIGIGLMGHGGNILFLLSGRAGEPPLVGTGPVEDFGDPLPQAMILTAIVITMGVAAFVLALTYRSYRLNTDEEVDDDAEDARIAEEIPEDDSGETDAATTHPDTDEADELDALPGREGSR